MARPREFAVEDAVEKAMAVFWDHGYEGASLPALLEGMNLTRGSLYKAFKDKKSLFLASLTRYAAEAVDPAVDLLTDDRIENGADRIEKLFSGVLNAVRAGDHRGCLLCNAAAGPSLADRDVATAVQSLVQRMVTGFEKALRDTPGAGTASPKDLHARATMLMTNYVGIRVLARSQANAEVLENAVTALLATVRG